MIMTFFHACKVLSAKCCISNTYPLKPRRTDGISRLEHCENFIARHKYRGKTPAPMQEVADHFVHMADLCAASAARNFVLDLLLFPGFTEAIQEEGGWGPVERLASELSEVKSDQTEKQESFIHTFSFQ